MTDASKLQQLTMGIIDALVEQDLQLAHQLVEDRLLFLQSLCAIGEFDSELVLAAKSVLTLDEEVSVRLEAEKSDIQLRLRDFMTAEKATQSYKFHSK